MLRRLALVILLSALTAGAVVGWFGYQAYVRITDEWAYRERFAQIKQAWPKPPAEPFAGHGSVIATQVRAKADTASMRVTVMVDTCRADSYVAAVAGAPEYVAVLVHTEHSWLPDVAAAWRDVVSAVRSDGGCVAAARPLTLRVEMDAPLGDRSVVDAVTGRPLAVGALVDSNSQGVTP